MLNPISYQPFREKKFEMAVNKDKKGIELTQDEKMLVLLRDELYEGSWDDMTKDLKDRLKSKPYIFKLVNRIQDDLVRVDKLRELERKNKINLVDFIEKS